MFSFCALKQTLCKKKDPGPESEKPSQPSPDDDERDRPDVDDSSDPGEASDDDGIEVVDPEIPVGSRLGIVGYAFAKSGRAQCFICLAAGLGDESKVGNMRYERRQGVHTSQIPA